MAHIFRRLRISALLAGVVAFNGFLNLATGIAPVLGLAPYLKEVPEFLQLTPVRQASGILSVFLGMLLIALGKGLFERRRRAWGISVLVLLVLMANNLARATTPQTALVSSVLILGLLIFHRRFDVPSQVRLGYPQVIGLVSVLFAVAYGIVGSYLLRDQFDGLQTWTDATYFTFVTYSTLGYGDILPATPNAKLFATSMIPIGLGSFITAVTALLGPAIENRIKGVLSIMERFQQATDHVVICGYSNVSESTIDELQQRHIPFVIVDDREDLLVHLRSKGHDVMAGDPAQKEVLVKAGLRRARALIAACDSDSVNVLIALTARDLREEDGADFRIVVRVEDEENVGKARKAGADEVISPSTSGGRLMATKAIELPPSEPEQPAGQ